MLFCGFGERGRTRSQGEWVTFRQGEGPPGDSPKSLLREHSPRDSL